MLRKKREKKKEKNSITFPSSDMYAPKIITARTGQPKKKKKKKGWSYDMLRFALACWLVVYPGKAGLITVCVCAWDTESRTVPWKGGGSDQRPFIIIPDGIDFFL